MIVRKKKERKKKFICNIFFYIDNNHRDDHNYGFLVTPKSDGGFLCCSISDSLDVEYVRRDIDKDFKFQIEVHPGG